MDAVDRRLVDALRRDGRASFAELARLVGLSASSVHERVSKLEATGVISGTERWWPRVHWVSA